MKIFLLDERGATAIEYAFICAFIVMLFIIGLKSLGESSTNQINGVADNVSNAMK